MAERPRQIVLSADGSGAVSGLSWASWGGQQATGTGTLQVDDCQPNCASGKFTGYPATVTLTARDNSGNDADARARWNFAAGQRSLDDVRHLA